MFPPANPNAQPIILKCWFWSGIGCSHQEGEIEHADAETQTAQIGPRNSLALLTVDFRNIRNVALAYGSTGQIIESFGSPRTNSPYLIEAPQIFSQVSA